MLVLTRKAEEAIVIGDNVTVTVLEIDGARVKIGIEAPRSIGVLRREIYEAIQRENLAAAQTPSPAQQSAALTMLRRALPRSPRDDQSETPPRP